jgi:iron complex outermembrane recepter protein
MVRGSWVAQQARGALFLVGMLGLSGLVRAWGQPQGTAATDPDVDLKDMSLEQLGNVQVTTVSKEPEDVWQTPVAIYILTQDDIRRSGATTLPDLLRTVPGVEVAEEQSNQWAVGIRGFGSGFSKGVLLLIDGRSAYTPLYEGVYWDVQDVMLQDIDRIEVIRGPGGTIWGSNAVNGVINIITKKAVDTQGTLVAGASGNVDRFTGDIREGFQVGNKLAMRLFAKGFVREPEDDPDHDAYDRWNLTHGGFRADWSATAQDSVRAQGDLYTGQSGEQVGLGVYHPLEQISVDGMEAVSGGDVLLRWEHRDASKSDFSLQTYFDRTNRQGPQFGETRDTVDIDFIDHIATLPRQNLIWGAGMRLSPSNFIQSQPTVDFTPHGQTDSIYSGFVQDTFALVPETERLSLTLGTKLEDNNFSGFEVQPNARLLWTPAVHASLWTSVSRAVRTPGRLDQDVQLTGVVTSVPGLPPFLDRIEGDPTFKSEITIAYEAGYRQLLTPTLYMDVAAFHNQYDNLESDGTLFFSTITTPISALVLNVPLANGIKGVGNGVEIAPNWKPTPWWELKGNLSLLHLALRPMAGFSDVGTVANYQGTSPHTEATAQSLLDLPHGVEFDVDYRFVSQLPAQNVRSYQTADVHSAWKIDDHFALSVSGRNLLQPEHEEFTGDNGNQVGIRRSVYGGLTWTR